MIVSYIVKHTVEFVFGTRSVQQNGLSNILAHSVKLIRIHQYCVFNMIKMG